VHPRFLRLKCLLAPKNAGQLCSSTIAGIAGGHACCNHFSTPKYASLTGSAHSKTMSLPPYGCGVLAPYGTHPPCCCPVVSLPITPCPIPYCNNSPANAAAYQANLPPIRVQAPPQQQQQQVMGPPVGQQPPQQQPQPAARVPPSAMAPHQPGQGYQQQQQRRPPAPAAAGVPVAAVPAPHPAVAAFAAPPAATARPATPPRQTQAPHPQQQQQPPQQPRQQQPPRQPAQQQQQPSQQQLGAPAVPQPAPPQHQQWAAPAAPQQAPPQQRQHIGATDTAPAPASSNWKHAFSTESEEHGGQLVAALAYCKQMPPPLPSGDGHSGWLVSSSKGVLNLWETNRAVPGECVLMVRTCLAWNHTSP
jgi:hypothetical protein